MFVNTLVLRTEVEPGASFAELLEQVRAIDLAAFAHADVPFERLVEALTPTRSTAHSPLFQVVLRIESTACPSLEFAGLDGDSRSPLDVEFASSTSADARANCGRTRARRPGSPASRVRHRDLFDAETVQGFADRFVRILAAVAGGDRDVAVGDIDILDAERDARS